MPEARPSSSAHSKGYGFSGVGKSEGAHRKRRRNDREEHGEKRGTVNSTKTRLRSVRRLLENKQHDMPATKRIALEREEASVQQDLQQKLDQAHKKKLVSKYHMVRFFERKKAERALKRAKKASRDEGVGGEMTPTAEEAVHRCEVDLNYTLFYPLSRPYVSLYPKEHGAEGEVNRTSPIWREVEQAMSNKTLQALRDGPGSVHDGTELPPGYASKPNSAGGERRASARARKGESSRTTRGAEAPESGEVGGSSDDGAGFFT